MIKVGIFFFLAAFAISLPLHAQSDSSKTLVPPAGKHSHLRISVITGGAGADIFETFGHSCIRVVDSDETGYNRDLIYNYGFYEEFTTSYLSQWLNGRVRCFLETVTYQQLMVQFDEEKRRLIEQELLLTNDQKERIVAFLKNNMKKENRYYEYDSFYDNCTTRMRDLLVKVLGAGYVQGNLLPKDSKLKFRDFSINMYCPSQHKYWFGLILNLFFASRTDRIMSNSDAMFNPDYFAMSLGAATIDGKKMSADPVTLYTDRIDWGDPMNVPFIVSIIVALITLISLQISSKPFWGNLVSFILLITTGVLGCYMVRFMMLDGEPAWKWNYGILWALPTNLLIPFLGAKVKRAYAVAAMSLLGVAFLVHIFRVQEFPLFEVGFLWLALLWVYAAMYKKSTANLSVK
jgi:hypothetical protein